MGNIKIKSELEQWLVKYITDSIHGMQAEDSDEFNKWAKSFKEALIPQHYYKIFFLST